MYDTLLNKGTEAVVYKVFEQLPLAVIVIPFYLFIVFISFVTASDSNTMQWQDCVRQVLHRKSRKQHLG